MTVLKNSKHEAFARSIVEGKSGREAYRAAGYKAIVRPNQKAEAATSAIASNAMAPRVRH